MFEELNQRQWCVIVSDIDCNIQILQAIRASVILNTRDIQSLKEQELVFVMWSVLLTLCCNRDTKLTQ